MIDMKVVSTIEMLKTKFRLIAPATSPIIQLFRLQPGRPARNKRSGVSIAISSKL
jgi:hypothetical protein